MSDILIARIDTFTRGGRFVARGSVIDRAAAEDANGEIGDNYIEAAGVDKLAVVEISAIAPTGPNPQNPQQIAPDVVQTNGGYEQAGAKLVGEVTLPEKERIEIVGIDKTDDTQAKVVQALADDDAQRGSADGDQNVSNEGTEGSVKDVSARVADMDEAGLDELERAENDREQPRSGVLRAIERRRSSLLQG